VHLAVDLDVPPPAVMTEQPSSTNSLRISGNRLAVVPEWLGGLVNLTSLDLRFNGLTALPESLSQLCLDRLTVAIDHFTRLTLWIADIPIIALSGDGEELPPEQRAALRSGEIKAFLTALCVDGVQISEGKLMLVGEGEAGKSTLLAALRGKSFNPGRTVTHGLEVKLVQSGNYQFSGSSQMRVWSGLAISLVTT
jgi:internalin A